MAQTYYQISDSLVSQNNIPKLRLHRYFRLTKSHVSEAKMLIILNFDDFVTHNMQLKLYRELKFEGQLDCSEIYVEKSLY